MCYFDFVRLRDTQARHNALILIRHSWKKGEWQTLCVGLTHAESAEILQISEKIHLCESVLSVGTPIGGRVIAHR